MKNDKIVQKKRVTLIGKDNFTKQDVNTALTSVQTYCDELVRNINELKNGEENAPERTIITKGPQENLAVNIDGNAKTADHAKEADSAKKAEDSEKLGGIEADEYLTKDDLDDITNTTVENSRRLGGIKADQYLLRPDAEKIYASKEELTKPLSEDPKNQPLVVTKATNADILGGIAADAYTTDEELKTKLADYATKNELTREENPTQVSKAKYADEAGNATNLGGKPASDYLTNADIDLAPYTTRKELTRDVDPTVVSKAKEAGNATNLGGRPASDYLTNDNIDLSSYATREELTRDINPTVVSKAKVANLANDIADNISTSNFNVTGTLNSTGNTNLKGTSIIGDLSVTGNITQSGETYITHAQDFYTKKDIIHTREDAVDPLKEGEITGIIADSYDAQKNYGALGFDRDGVARVGDVTITKDKSGKITNIDTSKTQAIATRENAPKENGIARWNKDDLKFDTILEKDMIVGNATKASGLNDSAEITTLGTTDNAVVNKGWVKNQISTVFVYKGDKATKSDLPKEGNQIGDVYYVTDTKTLYVWNGASWDELNLNINIDDYAKTTDITNGTIKPSKVANGATMVISDGVEQKLATTADLSGFAKTTDITNGTIKPSKVADGATMVKADGTEQALATEKFVTDKKYIAKSDPSSDYNLYIEDNNVAADVSYFIRNELAGKGFKTGSRKINEGGLYNAYSNFIWIPWKNGDATNNKDGTLILFRAKYTDDKHKSPMVVYYYVNGSVRGPNTFDTGDMSDSLYLRKTDKAIGVEPILLDSGSDLNSLVESAHWGKSYYAGGSNTVKNKPTGVDAFGIDIVRSADGYTTQVLHSSNKEPGLYYRVGASFSGNAAWKLLGQKGDTGATGATWKPTVADNGDLTWAKDSSATVPTKKNIKGDTGDTWKPTVDKDGNLSWAKDSGATAPTKQNIKGPANEKLSEKDTRSVNTIPSDYEKYYGQTIITEFKECSAIGVKNILTGTYCNLTTITPWGNSSGGRPVQFATNSASGGKLAFRASSADGKSWTAWGQIGAKGDPGTNGFTWRPSVATNGDISWTNNSGATAPTKQNIKGPRGNDIYSADRTTNLDRLWSEWTKWKSSNTTFVDIANAAKLLPGDTILINGTISDQSKKPITLVGEVVSISGTNVVVKGRQLLYAFNGTNGTNGFTWRPNVSAEGKLTWTNNGNTTAPTEANIKGKDGTNGFTWRPSVATNGDISWTNNSGATAPTKQNIKGPKGDIGDPWKEWHKYTTGSASGWIKILFNTDVRWMLSFRVNAYGSYNNRTYVFSGYNYSGQAAWYNPKVFMDGTEDANINVLFGHEKSDSARKWVCVPAENYYGVNVTDVVNGYNQVALSKGLISISYTTKTNLESTGVIDKTVEVSRRVSKKEMDTALSKKVSYSGAQTITGKLALNGGLSLNNSTPLRADMPYFLGIDGYNEGGTVKYVDKANAKVGWADNAGKLDGNDSTAFQKVGVAYEAPKDKWIMDNAFGIHMHNSDIIGANAIVLGDAAPDATEGLAFPRTDGGYDTINAYNGEAYLYAKANGSLQGGKKKRILTSDDIAKFQQNTLATEGWYRIFGFGFNNFGDSLRFSLGTAFATDPNNSATFDISLAWNTCNITQTSGASAGVHFDKIRVVSNTDNTSPSYVEVHYNVSTTNIVFAKAENESCFNFKRYNFQWVPDKPSAGFIAREAKIVPNGFAINGQEILTTDAYTEREIDRRGYGVEYPLAEWQSYINKNSYWGCANPLSFKAGDICFIRGYITGDTKYEVKLYGIITGNDGGWGVWFDGLGLSINNREYRLDGATLYIN